MSEQTTPSQFPSAPLRKLASRITDGSHFSPTPQEHGYLIANVKDMKSGYIDFSSCTRISTAAYRELNATGCTIRNGNVLLSKDGTVGRVVVYKQNEEIGALSSICLIVPTEEVDSAYLGHALQSQVCVRQFENFMSGSALRRLVLRDIRAIEIPVPSVQQQAAIAQILDTLDTAIRETESLIDKLKAIKQGLLHDLLTRGIDANGQLRPPQSEAPQLYKESKLGWIPRKWEVVPLGYCADIVSGVTLGRILNSPVAIELPYLRVANVQDGYLALGEIKTVSILPSELNRFALKVGDVLMNEGGDFDKLGRGAVWEGQIEPCLHQNHVFRVRCDDSKLLPAFLAAYSSSVRGKAYFVQASKQTTNLASINSTQLKAFGISCPSVAEQLLITHRLSTFDKKMAVEQEALEKLRQQKIGLMDDLLTGRVGVTPLLESMQQAAAQTEA
ncbi:restriction endonuclease subunit S [Pseudomonas sp. FP2335]|uniref:restriction endonuclease subunit S n=1 Tax=Pseudomonas sp. FP2335 TaxID=2954092 RepID=UPI0027329E8C|nr:restriction endonuclease subunit S [Pseudomonas sp. FP2335]WLH78587.1 restriction endonuclease subunit S [Pseudomonas sp. FP2335]